MATSLLKDGQNENGFLRRKIDENWQNNDRHNDFVELFDDVFLHTINGAELQYDDENTHRSKTCQLQKLIERFEIGELSE